MSNENDTATSLTPPADTREVHYFTVPEKVAKTTGTNVKRLGFVLLTLGEEKLAAQRAGTDPHAATLQQILFSLRYVDGVKVGQGDGSVEKVYASLHPKVRALCSFAVANLHGVEANDAADFYKSREVVSG